MDGILVGSSTENGDHITDIVGDCLDGHGTTVKSILTSGIYQLVGIAWISEFGSDDGVAVWEEDEFCPYVSATSNATRIV